MENCYAWTFNSELFNCLLSLTTFVSKETQKDYFVSGPKPNWNDSASWVCSFDIEAFVGNETTNSTEATTNSTETTTNSTEATTNSTETTINSTEATTNSSKTTINSTEVTTNSTETTTNETTTTTTVATNYSTITTASTITEKGSKY